MSDVCYFDHLRRKRDLRVIFRKWEHLARIILFVQDIGHRTSDIGHIKGPIKKTPVQSPPTSRPVNVAAANLLRSREFALV
jgi:hypothetical protein